jgi:hypothetical protein
MEHRNPDFMLDFPGFFTQEECSQYIEHYENMETSGFTMKRNVTHDKFSHEISDQQLFLHSSPVLKIGCGYLVNNFLEKFWEVAYPAYSNHFSILKESGSHKIHFIKLQKTKPGEGYHLWHHESSQRNNIDRILFFIVYLNTIEEGGETEFLYYKKRIKPIAGKLLMCPAYFTHTHRGNPPLEQDKYILTGWVEYD